MFSKKKPCAIGDIDIFTCFGPVLYEGSMEEVSLENAAKKFLI
jgi:hypothetical protein